MNRYFYLILFFTLTGLDLITKQWALYQLHVPWVMTPFLTLTFGLNCGIAFGFLSTCTWPGQSVLCAVAFFICGYLIKYHTTSPLQKIATALIVSGAMGNVISRMFYQGVIDFISFHYQHYYWPTFNLADTWVFMGTCLLVYCHTQKHQSKTHVTSQ